MKMWRIMVICKHCYDNSAESAYFWHISTDLIVFSKWVDTHASFNISVMPSLLEVCPVQAFRTIVRSSGDDVAETLALRQVIPHGYGLRWQRYKEKPNRASDSANIFQNHIILAIFIAYYCRGLMNPHSFLNGNSYLNGSFFNPNRSFAWICKLRLKNLYIDPSENPIFWMSSLVDCVWASFDRGHFRVFRATAQLWADCPLKLASFCRFSPKKVVLLNQTIAFAEQNHSFCWTKP